MHVLEKEIYMYMHIIAALALHILILGCTLGFKYRTYKRERERGNFRLSKF